MPRRGDRRHHAVGADGDDAVGVVQADRRVAELAVAIGRASPRRCCRRSLRSCGRVRREARRLVAAPHDDIGGALDLGDLVAVGDLLVAGEIQHLRAGRAQRLADREQHRIAEPAADQHHGLAGGDLGRRAGRPHQDDRLARLEHARTDRTSRPFPARWSRAARSPRSTQAPVSARPSIAERRAVARRARWSRNSAAGRTGPAGRRAPPAARCTTTSTMFGVSRRPRSHRGAQLVVACAPQVRAGARAAAAALRQHAADHRIALLGAAHRLHHIAGKGRVQIAEEADGAAVGLRCSSARGPPPAWPPAPASPDCPSSSKAWK